MKINKLSIKSKIAFWYIGLMISLAIIFLTTIIYISENLIRANAYKNLKNSVVSAFDEIEVYDGELTIDNDFIIFNKMFICQFITMKQDLFMGIFHWILNMMKLFLIKTM